MATSTGSSSQRIQVYSPCGRYRVMLDWAEGATAALTVAVKRDGAEREPSRTTHPAPSSEGCAAAHEYRTLLDAETSARATERSGCGTRTPEQLADMVYSVLVGRTPALQYTLVPAAEALQTAEDLLLFRLTYHAEFTHAVIVITLTPVGKAGDEASRGPRVRHDAAQLPDRNRTSQGGVASTLKEGEEEDSSGLVVARLQEELQAARERIDRLEAEKAQVTRYAKTTLQVLRDEMEGLKSKLDGSMDRRGALKLKDALASARRDADIAREETVRAQRECERLRQELRRVGRPVSASHAHVSSASRRGAAVSPAGSRHGSRDPTPARRSSTPPRREPPQHHQRTVMHSSSSPSQLRGRSMTPPPRGGSRTSSADGRTPHTAARRMDHHQQQHSLSSLGSRRGTSNRYDTPPKKSMHAAPWHPDLNRTSSRERAPWGYNPVATARRPNRYDSPVGQKSYSNRL
jgi:hypothetical protein